MYVGDTVETYVEYNYGFLCDFNLPKTLQFNYNGCIQFEYQVDKDKDLLEYCDFLVNFMKDFGLTQGNLIKNDRDNVLDLIFANSNQNIVNIESDNLSKLIFFILFCTQILHLN